MSALEKRESKANPSVQLFHKRSTSIKPTELSNEKNAEGLSKRGKTYMAATTSFRRKQQESAKDK